MKLFLSAFCQVLLIAINTWQLSHEKYLGAFIVGFGISLVWTFNVRRIVIADWSDRACYALGGAVGSLAGLMIAKLMY